MKNLIKEKTQLTGGWKDDVIYCYPANNNIEYNIITAPKQIKLSEILGKLNEKDYRKFEITRNGTCISLDNTNCYKDYLNIEDNKITDISDDMQTDEYKWLYALWIAGTEIIDDLEELDNAKD